MNRRTLFAFAVVVGAVGFGPPAGRPAEKAAPGEKLSAIELSLEVTALRELWLFQATPDQLEALRKLARDTAALLGKREKPKVSEKTQKTLADLRAALL